MNNLEPDRTRMVRSTLAAWSGADVSSVPHIWSVSKYSRACTTAQHGVLTHQGVSTSSISTGAGRNPADKASSHTRFAIRIKALLHGNDASKAGRP